MRLLILTQKVDKEDPILGFFHRWIEKFAMECEKITVVCLEKGEYRMPDNVVVFSLGKEHRQSRFQYIFRFYRYVWFERKNYDAVFVHMNQEYVLLGGVLWRLMRKKIAMWRNHAKGNFLTTVAVLLSHIVFCTSDASYTAKYKRTQLMPTGIDIDKFKNIEKFLRVPRSILYLGRISPVKKTDTFVEALLSLDKDGVEFTSTLVGGPDDKSQKYYGDIMETSRPLLEKGKLVFTGPLSNDKTPQMYGSHEIFVNLTGDGSLDKTIFSSMISGMIPLVSNNYFRDILPDQLIFEQNNVADLASKLRKVLSMDIDEKEKIAEEMKAYVMQNHSLDALVHRVLGLYRKL